MNIKKIIDGLYFTVGMMLFDPATGVSKTPDELNEDDRYTYDACMGAIELLKAQEPPTSASISSAIETLLHPQDADDSGMQKAIDTAVRAMRLLKAQEPRVMTLEEIQHTDAVWLETHGWVDGDVFETVLRCRSDFEDYVTEFATNDDCDITCVNSKIGVEWRCWTSRPTDKQKEATPWESWS